MGRSVQTTPARTSGLGRRRCSAPRRALFRPAPIGRRRGGNVSNGRGMCSKACHRVTASKLSGFNSAWGSVPVRTGNPKTSRTRAAADSATSSPVTCQPCGASGAETRRRRNPRRASGTVPRAAARIDAGSGLATRPEASSVAGRWRSFSARVHALVRTVIGPIELPDARRAGARIEETQAAILTPHHGKSRPFGKVGVARRDEGGRMRTAAQQATGRLPLNFHKPLTGLSA